MVNVQDIIAEKIKSNKDICELNKLSDSIIIEIDRLNIQYKGIITALCMQYIGEDYFCVNFDHQMMQIAFYTDKTYSTGGKIDMRVDIYHGIDIVYNKDHDANDMSTWWKKEWRFNIYVGGMGSFSMTEKNSTEYKYYAMISKLLDNANIFETECKNYYNEYKELFEELQQIDKKIEAQKTIIENEVKDNIASARRNSEIELYNAAENSSYFIIKKNSNDNRNMNFTYRNKLVELAFEKQFTTEYEAMQYVSNLYGYRAESNYKYIQKTKLKVA